MKYDECRVILACNLFEYRAINGLSQEDLALQIGIEVKTYARIERAEGHTRFTGWHMPPCFGCLIHI